MIMHILAVRNGAPNTMTIASMPYGSYTTVENAVENAVRMMKESGADALKLQLGKEGINIIKAVADAGVPIMSHVGLLPHKIFSVALKCKVEPPMQLSRLLRTHRQLRMPAPLA
jgi:3-methyl-2-oxobutanoate hydroxymethyltransferase